MHSGYMNTFRINLRHFTGPVHYRDLIGTMNLLCIAGTSKEMQDGFYLIDDHRAITHASSKL
jgi:hypothetical protein